MSNHWLMVAATGLSAVVVSGCATVPPAGGRGAVLRDAAATTSAFRDMSPEIAATMDAGAGYVVFPSVDQWGTGVSGGTWGRGVYRDSDGRFAGWVALNKASWGLQAGLRDYQLLMVFETEAAARRFREGAVSGSVGAVGVAGDAGDGVEHGWGDDGGVTVYQVSSAGLMAGVSVGVDVIRFAGVGSREVRLPAIPLVAVADDGSSLPD